ncbi:hypothetical protein NQ315_017281, partial [Exocentrus adspersus]
SLKTDYHDHRPQKQGVTNTLIHLARNICEPNELDDKLNHLVTALNCNETLNDRSRGDPIPGKEEFVATTYLYHNEKSAVMIS